ncbi:MAG: cyclopropane-fatty-acyl-phospholipid synthase family protein [Clostridium perfringens]|nr:cyclopropane-fatty-acyl-phospholipid synthase family protein [Clostridium perfringens]
MDLDKVFLKTFLKNFNDVPFTLRFADGEEMVLGTEPSKFKLILNAPLRKKELLASTSLAFCEAYMRKDIELEGDIFEALDLFLSHKDSFKTDFKGLPKIFHKASSKSKQKEEVSSHYDIGNDFYSLWLDKTMSYSCAYFKKDTDTLYDAQMNKIHHILKKLNLEEGQRLLDIGCGWGFLLIEAAKLYKVKGLGITLSEEQYKKFKERIAEEHLEDYLDVKLMDYRDLEKSGLEFDRVVSVGMLEHVGRENYELFMKNVSAVLKKKGLFLLHYISGLKESEGDAFIRKYIFPGGVIPSLREMINIASDMKFYTIDVESLRRHYMMTLLEWLKNYHACMDKVETMFDEEFIRMWDLYLSSCAAVFKNGITDLHQILFTKGVNNDIPLTREYLYED